MDNPVSSKRGAEEVVAKAGNLYERGHLPFSVYDQMRTGLENAQYAAVLDLWKSTMQEQLKHLHIKMTRLIDQTTAFRQDLEPFLRAWAAKDDLLSEQDWLDQPEGAREQYEALKALLAQMDAGNAQGTPPET